LILTPLTTINPSSVTLLHLLEIYSRDRTH
jgi:hypothetical protein